MEPNSYQTNLIFEDAKANEICDILFSKLVEKFPPSIADPDNDYVYKGFILSGKCAAIMQGTTPVPVSNVVFQTYQSEIYQYLQTALSDIFKCQVIAFKERILFYHLDIFFEVWWSDDPLNEIENSNIFIQNITSIPAQTL